MLTITKSNDDIESVTSIPVGFNPTVCGSLNLSSLTSISQIPNILFNLDVYYKALQADDKNF